MSHSTVSNPTAIFHLQDHVGLFGYGRVVGNNDDGAAVLVGKAPENLHDISGIGGVQVACGLFGEPSTRLSAICDQPPLK